MKAHSDKAIEYLIEYCMNMPECSACPYYKGCVGNYPDSTLVEILSKVRGDRLE